MIGVNSYGPCTYGLYRYGPYSYGPYSCGLYAKKVWERDGIGVDPAALAKPAWRSVDLVDREAMLDCAACGRPNALKQCSRCKQQRYCDQVCQRNAWRAGHKEHCAALASKRALSPPEGEQQAGTLGMSFD